MFATVLVSQGKKKKKTKNIKRTQLKKVLLRTHFYVQVCLVLL